MSVSRAMSSGEVVQARSVSRSVRSSATDPAYPGDRLPDTSADEVGRRRRPGRRRAPFGRNRIGLPLRPPPPAVLGQRRDRVVVGVPTVQRGLVGPLDAGAVVLRPVADAALAVVLGDL